MTGSHFRCGSCGADGVSPYYFRTPVLCCRCFAKLELSERAAIDREYPRAVWEVDAKLSAGVPEQRSRGLDPTGKTILTLAAFGVLAVILLFAFLAYSFRTVYTDVTGNQGVAAVSGKCFELLKDSFIFRWENSQKKLAIDCAGCSSLLPVSIADYQRHPGGWAGSPAYYERWGRSTGARNHVIEAVPAGTRFRVMRVIREVNPEAGTFLVIQVAFPGRGKAGWPDAGALFGPGEQLRLNPCSP
jgi:hypothetical protein